MIKLILFNVCIIFYNMCGVTIFFKIFCLFLERGCRRERNIDAWEILGSVASCMPPTGDLAHNPDMCPDQEFNQWPFGLQSGAQSTEPHQPRLITFIWIKFFTKTNKAAVKFLYHIFVPHLLSNIVHLPMGMEFSIKYWHEFNWRLWLGG